MPEPVTVDYATADAWKRRAEAAANAEKLSRQAAKAALSAIKAKGITADPLAQKARLASQEAAKATRNAENVWADTADIIEEGKNR